MAWDFETEPAFQEQLDWMTVFVRDEVAPLDHVLGSPYDVANPDNVRLVRPLQAIVKQRGLWGCHLGAELGGLGFGQIKLALMNEILGQSRFAPVVFGCQAPDSGNAEILAQFGEVPLLASAARKRDSLVLRYDRAARRSGSQSVYRSRRARC